MRRANGTFIVGPNGAYTVLDATAFMQNGFFSEEWGSCDDVSNVCLERTTVTGLPAGNYYVTYSSTAVVSNQNANCTDVDVPYTCCTGSGTGTCDGFKLLQLRPHSNDAENCAGTWSVEGAAMAPIILNPVVDNELCTGAGAPFDCCTGSGTGACNNDADRAISAMFEVSLDEGDYCIALFAQAGCSAANTPNVVCDAAGDGFLFEGDLNQFGVFEVTDNGNPKCPVAASVTGHDRSDACSTATPNTLGEVLRGGGMIANPGASATIQVDIPDVLYTDAGFAARNMVNEQLDICAGPSDTFEGCGSASAGQCLRSTVAGSQMSCVVIVDAIFGTLPSLACSCSGFSLVP